MNWDDIKNIGAIIGAVGGALGLYTFAKNLLRDNKKFNQDVYNNLFKLKYIEIFDDRDLGVTDHINLIKIHELIAACRQFKQNKNSFKGILVNYKFNRVFDKADVIILSQFFGFIGLLDGLPPHHDRIVEQYRKHQDKIAGLKQLYADFYRSIFDVLN